MIKTSLKAMSTAELNKVLSETHQDMERRKNIKFVEKEIRKLLGKHNVTFLDLGLVPSDQQKRERSKTALPNRKEKKIAKSIKGSQSSPIGNKLNLDKRKVVLPKYKQLNGPNVWSGRGRAPAWVTAICKSENISIQEFKSDPRFKS